MSATWKDPLPLPFHRTPPTPVKLRTALVFTGAVVLALAFVSSSTHTTFTPETRTQCDTLHIHASPSFKSRDRSDRFEEGYNATFIRNATIFDGNDTIREANVLLSHGIIKVIGLPDDLVDRENTTVIEANGAWLTPGLVDMHSHLGISPIPFTRGTSDMDSKYGPVAPWLRTIDALNTHDEGFAIAIAEGVTSAQVVAGNDNLIGGQSFMVKPRKTLDRSPTSMVIEAPFNLTAKGKRWRHLKQTCGEQPKERYQLTRMDSQWALRSAYSRAKDIRGAQDTFCATGRGKFEEGQDWEVLVDVLRGNVKVSTFCDEAVDLDAMIRLSNEFGFEITSLYHASDAWQVPRLLNQTWGAQPILILSSTTDKSRRESYRSSEFAPAYLSIAGLRVGMMSSQHRSLLAEAQLAYHHGLPAHLALAAITSVPALASGLNHRIGKIKLGYDADVVLWDRNPLKLGARAASVWIDGIPQLPVVSFDDSINQVDGRYELPKVPHWTEEMKLTDAWDGLPPLYPRRTVQRRIVFRNVKDVWTRTPTGAVQRREGSGLVVVEHGRVACVGDCIISREDDDEERDLKGGSISIGIMAYGHHLGIQEIQYEPSSGDGLHFDAFANSVPKLLGDAGGILRVMGGLRLGDRSVLHAYRSGVTYATSSFTQGTINGISTTFRTGSTHLLQKGSIIQDHVALHIHLSHTDTSIPSISTKISALRRLLSGYDSDSETGKWFRKAAEGITPLIITVDSADIMSSLLLLKRDVEDQLGSTMRMVFEGAAQAHVLAEDLAGAGVGVIIPAERTHSGSQTWDQRELDQSSNKTLLSTLLEHGIQVGLSTSSAESARYLRFELGRMIEQRLISEKQAYELVSRSLERLLGVRWDGTDGDLVLVEGGTIFELAGKVVGVVSKGRVELF